MKTLIRVASDMEASPHMYPVDPRVDHTAADSRFAFAGAGSLSAFPRA